MESCGWRSAPATTRAGSAHGRYYGHFGCCWCADVDSTMNSLTTMSLMHPDARMVDAASGRSLVLEAAALQAMMVVD